MLTEENKELYESYFQENADYYISQIKKFDASGKYSFNVPAFFLGFFWMAYRKMYTHILILIGIIFIEGIIEEALYENDLISYNTYQAIDIISRIIWSIAFGFLANRLYIIKSKKDINKIIEIHSGQEQRIQVITKKGGTNLLKPIILVILIVLLLML